MKPFFQKYSAKSTPFFLQSEYQNLIVKTGWKEGELKFALLLVASNNFLPGSFI